MNKNYPTYKRLDLSQIAQKVQKFWEKNQTFSQSLQSRSEEKSYTFFEGPPSANGKPGIHHAMARTIKDIFCRYKTLQGFHVKRKAGWDTHGLPVELQVEKQLGITKEDIGNTISIEEYNQKCRETVMTYQDEWNVFTQKLGYWVDLDHPYVTYEREYIDSVWHLLKKLYDKGFLYKGYNIQPYSPAAGTGLSNHEINQPGCYKPVKDVSIVAQFKIAHTENDYFLAWTTTPWTLPANSALAVGKKIKYVKVKTFNPYTRLPVQVILAKDVLNRFFHPDHESDHPMLSEEVKPGAFPWAVVETCTGADLIGQTYEQLMPYIQPKQPAFTVIEGDFVSTEDGTGIVHIAPTFGADDMRVAKKAGIPPIMTTNSAGDEVPIVDKQGRFVEAITDFASMYVKEDYEPDEVRQQSDYQSTDVRIAIHLKAQNKAFKVEKYEHNYPHCWRTDKPVLYYPLDSWFIKTTACKERLIALNKTIHWQPEATGLGRFGNWLENLVDWNLSRSRFWGTPLPIWRTEDQKEEKCIDSVETLREEVKRAVERGLMETPLPDDFDPHRPFVDEIILVSDSGQKMYRESDLIDVWFDAGAMPYAQWHYPFENQSLFQANFPADFIAEGVDQTRGWFFTLHAIAVMLFDEVAFKNVITNGLVLDKNGNKMSKRLGNAIDPIAILDDNGADSLRWYMIAQGNPWDNLKFDQEELVKVQRRFFGTLHNTYSFFALYANIDGFNFEEEIIPLGNRTESDRWVISRLNTLIKEVTAAFEAYEPTKAARHIQEFVVNDLSNWYVRLNRKRFWKSEDNIDKKASYQTLHSCLLTIAQLASPIAPFYMEELYRALQQLDDNNDQSVHLDFFPSVEEEKIDLALEQKMRWVQTMASLVHALRKKHKMKVRQPLAKMLFPVVSDFQKAQIQSVEDVLLAEVNVKAIEYIDDTTGLVKKKIKPNFKRLGKLYGPDMKAIAQAVAQFNQEQIKQLEKEGTTTLQLTDKSIHLSLEDVEIIPEDIPGWLVTSEGEVTIALDTQLNNELIQEGVAREFINRIQNLRKEKQLDVQDKIILSIKESTHDDLFKQAIQHWEAHICTETQAKEIVWVTELINKDILAIDDKEVEVSIGVVS